MAEHAGEPIKDRPTPLTSGEQTIAWALVIAGALLMVALLVWFLAEADGTLRTKEVHGSDTTEYSDTLVIAALGLGGLLVLCGAFFGRLREITLPGGGGIKLAELAEPKKEALQEKIAGASIDADVPDELKPRLATAAYDRSLEKFRAQFPGAVAANPSDQVLDSLAAEAVEEVKPEIAP
jgi:hypothetical protein